MRQGPLIYVVRITREDYTLRNIWRNKVSLFIKRARSCIHAAHAGLIYYSHLQIFVEANLTREPHVISQFRFDRQPVSFQLTHSTRIALEDFDTASRATSIAAAAVQNVDPCVFNRQYQFLTCGSGKFY